MKVKELKEILETVSDDLEVILATDPEGNGFNVCDSFSFYGFMKIDNWVEIGNPEPEPSEDGSAFEECMILWP